MQDDDLTPEERRQFGELPREIPPAADLEDRVVARLRHEGAARQHSRARRPWLLAAAAVALFVSGLAAGRLTVATGRPAEPSGSRYLLLLYGAATTTPEAEAARVAEYGAWARSERTAGRLETGEKLSDQAVVMGSWAVAPAQPAEPSGFFVIRASSPEEAQATAGRCPHVVHGGAVVVRKIE